MGPDRKPRRPVFSERGSFILLQLHRKFMELINTFFKALMLLYVVLHEPRLRKKRSSGFLTMFDTNRPVQLQKMIRDLKFCIQEIEGLYYPSSENKGADQLLGYREADLRLLFSHMQKAGFLRTWLTWWRRTQGKPHPLDGRPLPCQICIP